ncbi:MAG: cyclic nucleotide-binding domain-containing protein [Candidatus Coatesbacteria bacterium]|nr:cyclic nucleotide-binding domain-containing protein [Candidatus Coatesbacteria bacterium]
MKEKEMDFEKIAPIIRQSEIFSGLNDKEIISLCSLAEEKEYEATEIIIKQGDEASSFYMIVEGTVDVYKEQKGNFYYIHSLEPKELFGEMALVDDSPRSATVKAKTKVIVISFSRVAFHQYLAISSDAGIKILKIINKRLYNAEKQATREIIRLQDTTIFAMAKLAEGRDPNMGCHLERMREFALLIARAFKERSQRYLYMDNEFLDLLYKCAPLHDIGKIGIPDHILLKPDYLDNEEKQIMRTHTTLGAETLQKASQKPIDNYFLDMAICIALSHHERWDGSGYPQGLKGEDIPLSARIINIADVYDSLTSDRIYRKAFSHEEACKIIKENEESKFDPSILDVFDTIEDDLISIKNRFPD